MIGMNLGLWNRGQVIDPSWWVPKDGRTLDLDALNWRMWDSENGARAPNALTVSRPSGRGRRTSLGVFETLADNLIARDHDDAGTALGLQIEPQATYNRVSSLMTGFVAGSPGTAPDGWSIPAPAGLTRTLSLVTTSGRPKLRVHYAGAPASDFQFIAQFFPSLTVAAAAGQTWTYAARFSGEGVGLSGQIIYCGHLETDGSNTTLRSDSVGGLAPLTHLRRSKTVTLGASTTYIRCFVATGLITAGTTCDFWIDIEAPQLTQTSYLPSEFLVGASAGERFADDLSRSVTGLIGAAEGGLYFEGAPINAATAQILGGLYWAGGDLIEARRTGAGRIVVEAVSGGVQVAYLDLGAHIDGALVKVALGWAENDFAARMSGGSLLTDSSFQVPVGVPTLRLGSRPGPVYLLNGHLRRATAYPTRAIMTDAKIGELVA